MFRKLALLAVGMFIGLSIGYAVGDTSLRGKPIPCANTKDTGRGLVMGFLELGMSPIFGFIGSTYTEEGLKFPSSYYILYSTENNQVAILELIGDNVCIVTGASSSPVSFDSEVMRELLLDFVRQ